MGALLNGGVDCCRGVGIDESKNPELL